MQDLNMIRSICDSLEGKNTLQYEVLFVDGNPWRKVGSAEALDAVVAGYAVRIREEFITREIRYPAPEKMPPSYGTYYFIAGTEEEDMWQDREIDFAMLEAGRVYLSAEKVIEVSEAIWGCL